jgi:aromatic ring-opening dioxygenase catalytic subunit (LigB family)
MGQLVAGFGTSHIVMKRGSAGDKGERVFRGMKEVGARIRARRPDLVVICSSDHLYNYDLNVQAPFAVATDGTHVPFGDMQLPTDPLPGHAEFAASFIAFAAARDVDLTRLHGYRPDHGVVIPALLLSPERAVPIVPLIVNTAMEPAPLLRRSWRLGVVLRDFVREARPASERVVVLGTGGLSHWLGVPEMGRVNNEFDREVIDTLVAGRAGEVLDWSSDDIRRRGGNGGLEILSWWVMAGAVGAARGEQVYYEEVPEWVTGMGGVQLTPASERTR